jgi:hypothetical protein
VLNNSGWSGGLAELALAKAADMWNKLARIVVKSRPTIYINEPCAGFYCLRNYLNDKKPDMNHVASVMAANNVTAKHWTFFIASPGSAQAATDTNHWPYPSYMGVESLSDGGSTGGALTLAHEWGHGFGLWHTPWPSTMIFGPLAWYGLQESLNSVQRAHAREGTAAFR